MVVGDVVSPTKQPLIPYEMGDDGMELTQKMWVSDGFNIISWAVSHF